VGTTLTEIFNQLKELEKKFNEIKYPSEAAFQPSFSSKIRKAEQDSLISRLPAFALDEFFEKIEE
jgi:type III secretory pathway component EscR